MHAANEKKAAQKKTTEEVTLLEKEVFRGRCMATGAVFAARTLINGFVMFGARSLVLALEARAWADRAGFFFRGQPGGICMALCCVLP